MADDRLAAWRTIRREFHAAHWRGNADPGWALQEFYKNFGMRLVNSAVEDSFTLRTHRDELGNSRPCNLQHRRSAIARVATVLSGRGSGHCSSSGVAPVQTLRLRAGAHSELLPTRSMMQ